MAGTARSTLSLRTGRVDLGRQRLITPDGVVSLTTRETELLSYLSERSGKAVSREDLLVDVWNYRATNPTRAVDLAVKRLRSKIEEDPKDPIHILSVHGVGYRFEPLDEPMEPVPAVKAPSARTNVAPARTTFVGRNQELAQLCEMFAADARLVTVMGAAGTGKTRLARHHARNAKQFEGGSWFCDLAEISSEEGILAVVRSVLQLPVPASADAAAVGAALGSVGPVLVTLDNFEQLVRHAPTTLGVWLDLAPAARFVVTSRERLHVRGERILDLAPLRWDDALELLVSRASAVRPGQTFSPADREILAGVVAQLDGIPLAIELAASRLGSLSPAQLSKRLASRFRLLGDPRGDRPRRHTTLRAALDWSWELMSSDEQRGLMALSVFEGGFGLEAAEELLGDDPDAPWPADLIQSLRDKSLVAMDESAGADLRYRLLESIREYASRKLDDTSDGSRIRALHSSYFVRECERTVDRLHGAGGEDRLDDLQRERANLMAVARFAPDPESRVRATLCLVPVLEARGPSGVLDEMLSEASRTVEERDLGDVLQGRIGVDRGNHALVRARIAEAAKHFKAAAKVAPHRLDVRARALLGLGRVRRFQGQLPAAGLCVREAIDLFSRLADRSGEGRARAILADVLTWQGCIDEAETEYQRSLRILKRAGDRWTEGLLLAALSTFQLEHRGDAEQAERLVDDALRILEEIGDERGILGLLLSFGVSLARMGRSADAVARLAAARERVIPSGDRVREAQVVAALGWALHEAGDLELAETRIEEALVLHREATDRVREATALRLLGCLRSEQGRHFEAATLVGEALAIFEETEHDAELAVTRMCMGLLALFEGRLEDVEPWLSEAPAVLPWIQKQSRGFLSVTYAALGDQERAEEALEQAIRGLGESDVRELQVSELWASYVKKTENKHEPGGAWERRMMLKLLES